MHLIDTHCHLDLYDDPASVVAEAVSSGMTVIAVTNAPFVFDACQELTQNAAKIHPAIGLHPELVGEYGHQVDDLLERLDAVQFVGEIGIDYRVTPTGTHDRQRDIFRAIVRACASRPDMVMTVHSRGAEADVVRILEERGDSNAILHWYSGALKHLAYAHEIGCYFSVNTAMLTSQNGRRLIERMDRSRVLTETDGPYTKCNNRRTRPVDVEQVVTKLAELWREDSHEVARLLAENWGRVARFTSGHV
jgi:TatD DNase family protein